MRGLARRIREMDDNNRLGFEKGDVWTLAAAVDGFQLLADRIHRYDYPLEVIFRR